MKKIIRLLALITYTVILAGCIDNNIGYDEVTNVPEGIYITGTASEFSVEAAKGALKSIDGEDLYSINAWLKPEGDFKISLVGEDGMPVRYGNGGEAQSLSANVKTYQLAEAADKGITVDKEGLYQIILNKTLSEVNVIPYDFKIKGALALTESGETTLQFQDASYDKISHVVTWKSSDTQQLVLPTSFVFNYAPTDQPALVKVSEQKVDTIPTNYTGLGGSIKTNVLTAEPAGLTNKSDISMNLRHKGNYIFTVQYDVVAGNFTAKIEGEELIEPEPTGYPTKLYMAGQGFGNFGSTGMVEFAPVGVAGNGAFWTMQHFNAGETFKWSNDAQGANSFATLGTNINYTVDAQGNATVTKSGFYLVFVDMYKKLISFEEPELYGIGDCFGGGEALLKKVGNEYVATTTGRGNLTLYGTSIYNSRDWNSMEFTIINGKIVYKGIGEEPNVPVAAGVSVRINGADNTANLVVNMSPKDVPTSASAVYLVADNIGNMNWGSDEVVSLWNTWNSDQQWFTLHYFKAGMGIRLSTDKAIGSGEFVQLDDNSGFTVSSGKAVVPSDGVYMVYVDLSGRKLYIEKATIYGYGTATNDPWNSHKDPFVANSTGESVSLTLANTGRLRLDPTIPQIAKGGAWKRELYFDIETGAMAVRKSGEPEPNKDYVWTAGTKVTLNFNTMKASFQAP